MKYYVIDANVMMLAGTKIGEVPDDQQDCWMKCVDFINDVIKKKYIVVIDDNWEVLKEYKNAKGLDGYPNSANDFLKYVLTQNIRMVDVIHLDKIGDNKYKNYPNSEKLNSFDPPDRKYIALSFTHPKKPPIIEATDSKWWDIKYELSNYGIELIFIDEAYICDKYSKKFGVS